MIQVTPNIIMISDRHNIIVIQNPVNKGKKGYSGVRAYFPNFNGAARHILQLEVSRLIAEGLYTEEDKVSTTANMETLETRLNDITTKLSDKLEHFLNTLNKESNDPLQNNIYLGT